MNNLSNYLLQNRYVFRFTSFVDYARNNIKGDGLRVPYYDTLEKIGLSLDKKRWMELKGSDHYGDWALKNNAVDASDGFHPKYPEANEGWVRQILIPYFVEQGIIKQ